MKRLCVINIALIVVFLFSAMFSVESASADHDPVIDNDKEAPDFSLPDTNNRNVTLSEHEGKENIVLVFYRGQW